MTNSPNNFAAEFSRPYSPEDIKEGKTEFSLVANEKERAALAKRFELLEIIYLSANVTIVKRSDPAEPLFMKARILSNVVQECVVSLVPVESVIDERFTCTFVDGNAEQTDKVEIDIDPHSEDPPEQLVNGCFDAGEIITQHFGIHLNQFPRAEGAEMWTSTISPEKEEVAVNPFSVLKKLHGR